MDRWLGRDGGWRGGGWELADLAVCVVMLLVERYERKRMRNLGTRIGTQSSGGVDFFL